jgi:hypothetical protein
MKKGTKKGAKFGTKKKKDTGKIYVKPVKLKAMGKDSV